MKKLLYILILILCFVMPVYATNYHCDQTGGAANLAACDDPDPGEDLRCTMTQINAGITGGDTAYLYNYGGDITTKIRPENSGSSGSWIIYEVASGESVTIHPPSGYAVDLTPIGEQKFNYIKIQKGSGTAFNLVHKGRGIQMVDNENIVIDGVTMSGTSDNCTGGNVDLDGVINVEILNSDFTMGAVTGNCPNDNIEINRNDGSLYSHNILIYNNHFHYATHNGIVYGNNDTLYHFVVKDNYFNNPWRSGMGTWRDHYKALIEGNVFEDIGWEADQNPYSPSVNSPGAALRAAPHPTIPSQILRKNILDSNTEGFFHYTDIATSKYLYFYNNTIYNSVYGDFLGSDWYEGQMFGFVSNISNTFSDSAFINNIFAFCTPRSDYETIACVHGTATSMGSNIRFENNLWYDPAPDSYDKIEWPAGVEYNEAWHDTNQSQWSGNTNGDPLFVNASGNNFNIQPGPAKDTGTHLTEIATAGAESGSSVDVYVDDAGFFFSKTGWGMTDTTNVLSNDYVCIGTDSQPREVTAVDYSSSPNKLTLTSAPARSLDDPVYLAISSSECYKYNGPDIGAFEYDSGAETLLLTPTVYSGAGGLFTVVPYESGGTTGLFTPTVE